MRARTFLQATGIVLALSVSGVAIAQMQGDMRFLDVAPDSYFASAVQRLASKGIIKGYEDGRFGPFDYVTRGQVSVMLDRYDQVQISKMRAQIEAIRQQLGLGVCGDGQVQAGEECDDGNAISGDGCSLECITELHCAGGHKVGDKFPSTDGCNVCTCTEAGLACTERVCTQKKCFKSSDCAKSEVCSVDQGDCRYPCPKGAVCVQACAGVCLPKGINSVCGNGICEDGESAYQQPGGTSMYCPQDCTPQGPVCGNGICESGEADQYGIPCSPGTPGCSLTPVLTKRGSCSTDCEGGITLCQEKKKSIDVIFQQKLACDVDTDCTIFGRACSPYQTCGKPIRKDAILEVTAAVLEYTDACSDQEPSMCVACVPNKAICQNHQCVLANTTP